MCLAKTQKRAVLGRVSSSAGLERGVGEAWEMSLEGRWGHVVKGLMPYLEVSRQQPVGIRGGQEVLARLPGGKVEGGWEEFVEGRETLPCLFSTAPHPLLAASCLRGHLFPSIPSLSQSRHLPHPVLPMPCLLS